MKLLPWRSTGDVRVDNALDPEVEDARGDTSEDRLRQLELLARWMDSVFEVPGLGVRFGVDALVGLVPGLGDTLTSFVSLHILNEARRFGISRVTMFRMGANIAIDYLLGSVPLLGDAFDVYWKANNRNVALLRRHLEGPIQYRRRAQRGDRWFMVGLVALLVLLLIGSIAVSWFIITSVVKAIIGS
jgi:uncharacterized protein DUF4112